MYLQSITLRQFRSYHEAALSINPGVNLFLGGNGSGKTNLLEAVAVLATGLSPRGADTESLIEWGASGFYISGAFGFDEEDMDPLTLEMRFQRGASRVIRQNGQDVVRLKDLIGRVPMVSFVPEDLALIKGEPVLRRRAVNMILMQGDAAYAAAVRDYNDALRSRNAALKQLWEDEITEEVLEPWDKTLIQSGLFICRKREAFLKEFSVRAGAIHKRMSGGKEKLTLEYRPSFSGPWDDGAAGRWQDKMRSLRSQEMALGSTMVGPHRDDVMFSLDGRPARAYASEGQKRTGAVAFKLAEVPYIQEKQGQKPICLLDDVLSELDADRAAHLLDELARTGQCVVTLTGLESWPANRPLPASIYQVEASIVTPQEKTAPVLVEEVMP